MVDTLNLYVLARTDLPSLNPGKMMAQLCHAANQFTHHELVEPLMRDLTPDPMVVEWAREANGFGTTITLDVGDLKTLEGVINTATELKFPAGLVVDPSYPYLVNREIFDLLPQTLHVDPPAFLPNSMVFVTRRETTCGYVFGRKSELEVLLRRFKLMA